MGKTVFRLPPCPAYDAPGTERWLGEMAAQGLHLKKEDSIHVFATFEPGEAKPVRYRLEAAPGGTGLFSANGGEPAPDAREMAESFGWEYVANRGMFFIFRSEDPAAPEFHTDPKLQAEGFRRLKRNEYGSAGWSAVLLALLIWSYAALGPLLMTLRFGTVFTLLLFAVTLWEIIGPLRQARVLGRLEKHLRSGAALETAHVSLPDMRLYRVRRVFGAVCAALFLAAFGSYFFGDRLGMGRIPLEDYQKPLPFATLLELTGGATAEPYLTGINFNSARERHDLLAPVQIEREECPRIRAADGTLLYEGVYDVSYFRTQSAFLADRLFHEMLRAYSEKQETESLLSLSGADRAVRFTGELRELSVLLQKGKTVALVRFGTAQDPETVDALARRFAESLE